MIKTEVNEMSIAGIFAYLARACAFAAAVSGLWWLMRRILKRKTRALDLLAVAYVAAVTEIIALRIATPSVARGVQWIPLKTTIGEWSRSTWAFVYHVGGNLAWFVPLGALIQLKKPNWSALQAFAIGAGFSALLEMMQYLLSTGMTDVDDVILNAIGALLGAAAVKILRHK